ncbi:hypothetical protein [Mesorhizobium humile]|jgi:hypothetical protein|uniref:Uncharacterized protein n=1 Tax=Mesorhizobium humile TaxID=3072313 RepID=A0ABU4YEF9_9HYPH|nr:MULTISPECIES: hypothetical protein [unclassified Mesorhizobium]MDX8460572.1 hypothetical protein [Mesorhizobium sp. VK2D]MDX8485339.1 hypothetical protein [Mesorhizobium sp. VK2B]
MSHLLFVLALGFVAWQWFAKGRAKGVRPKSVRPEGGRRAAQRTASSDDTDDDAEGDEIADVAEAVSSFLGEKGLLGEGLLGETGRELLGQAVSRALQESGLTGEIERRAAEVLKPLRQASAKQSKKAAAQAQGKQRAKYLLDGDGGYRQRSDRTARLEQSFRGKGLCSPR